jgi:hypothetical protein
MAEVTYCVTWTSGGQAKIQCTDVKSTDADEGVARARCLRLAKARMDAPSPNGEPPDQGTNLKMERFVGEFGMFWAQATVNAPWPEWQEGWDGFVSSCMNP